MAYEPHYRVTMIGTLPGSEQFTMSLSLAQNAENNQAPLVGILDPNATVWNDIANDCKAFFGRPDTGISQQATLTRVKIAPIGANGLYTGAPVEVAVNQNGGRGINGTMERRPNQTALAVTLHTAGDLGRVKGRFYLPMPQFEIGTDGRFSEGDAELCEASAQTFLNALNNQPGIDVLGIGVVVASQGRTRQGVQVLGPDNHLVTAVSVGRVPDTQRRRRNKLLEQKTSRPVNP